MIVGFTGTREGLTDEQSNYIIAMLEDCEIESLIHGDAVGADVQVAKLARLHKRNIFIEIYPCHIASQRGWSGNWDKCHEPNRPLERNKHIVNACDVLFACPKGFEEEMRSGTWATVRYARKIGKPVVIVYPDGSINV